MLAYFDSFAGLVPCRVIAVGDWSDNSSLANVQFTATRGAYKRGEVLTTRLSRVVPRTAIRRRMGSTTVLPYSWPRIVGKVS
jgi:hypothetical protein